MTAAKKAAPSAPQADSPVPGLRVGVDLATHSVDFDLDAARAARVEVSGEPFRFRFAGEAYQIPPAKQWPIAAVDDFASGKMRAAMESLLGPEQWSRFGESEAELQDLTDLFKALSAWQGLTPGE